MDKPRRKPLESRKEEAALAPKVSEGDVVHTELPYRFEGKVVGFDRVKHTTDPDEQLVLVEIADGLVAGFSTRIISPGPIPEEELAHPPS